MCTFLALALALAPGQEPAPAARGSWTWNDFPVFVWRERYRGKPLPDELVEPFGGVILMREEPSDWARLRGLAYLVWNVAGRDALHLDADEAWRAKVERWIETRDEKLLVREPCLNDPATQQELEETLARTLAFHGEHPGLGFVLGDEVSLTPNGDPFDLCRCAFCEAPWRVFAKATGLPERAPSTDEVRLALLEDDDSLLGAWLARKRIEQVQVWRLLERLAGVVRSHPTHVPVGLLGLRPEAMGGLPFERLLQRFDFVEGYPLLDTRERIQTPAEIFYRRAPAELATVFLASESPDGAAWVAWDHWMHGGDGLVLWNDARLEDDTGQGQRLAGTVERIRAIQRRFPRLQSPQPALVALVRDADSIAASWLRDALLDGPTWPKRGTSYQFAHGTRERKMDAWLRSLRDQRIEPGSVEIERIREQRSRFRVLILIDQLVLDDDDIEDLERHLDSGGRLIVDGELGWVDRAGHRRRDDPFERLRTHSPGSVLRASAATPVASLLSPDELAPWQVELKIRSQAADARWSSTMRFTQPVDCLSVLDSRPLLTLLPQYPTREERRGLHPIRLDVVPPKDMRIEWIHPEDGSVLPPGDAAVFLLHPLPEALDDPLPESR